MLTAIGNIHHHKLPTPGEIGYITCGRSRWGETLYWHGRRRRCIVESYPLCDGARYRGRFLSIGIHTVTVRFLDNGHRARFSGFYFTTTEDV